MKSGLFCCLVLTALFSTLTMTVSEVVAKGCMDGGCHQKLTVVRYMHGPIAAELAGANGCEMCHVQAGAKCSVSKGGSFKIKSKGLCLACHAKGTGSQHSTREIESKCLKCHSPHGSDVSPQMLRANRK